MQITKRDDNKYIISKLVGHTRYSKTITAKSYEEFLIKSYDFDKFIQQHQYKNKLRKE